MNKIMRTLGLIIAILSLTSCNVEEKRTFKLDSPNISLGVTFNTVEEKNNYSVIYADLVLSNYPSTVNSIDLSCFVLTSENHRSDAIYVDSIASVLTNEFRLSKNKTTEVPVYWTMSGTSKQEISFNNIKVIEICSVLGK